MQRGLEPEAVLGFIEIEVSALAGVMLPLRVTQTNPPFIAGCID